MLAWFTRRPGLARASMDWRRKSRRTRFSGVSTVSSRATARMRCRGPARSCRCACRGRLRSAGPDVVHGDTDGSGARGDRLRPAAVLHAGRHACRPTRCRCDPRCRRRRRPRPTTRPRSPCWKRRWPSSAATGAASAARWAWPIRWCAWPRWPATAASSGSGTPPPRVDRCTASAAGPRRRTSRRCRSRQGRAGVCAFRSSAGPGP